jgi:hypothetical protein
MNGYGFLTVIASLIAFVIAVLITRWIFRIREIVGLLKVIAQELRARNAAEGIDNKLNDLGIGEYLGKQLHQLYPKEYKIVKSS